MSANKKTTKTSPKDLKTNLELMNKKPLSEPIEGEIVPSDVGGAPTKYTPQVVNKLVLAFNSGYNISQACQYSGISRETYYSWLEEQPGFSDRMDEAKSMPNRRAREVIIAAIDAGDANLAFKYLQALDPDFKAKLQVDPGEALAETRDKIKDFLNEPTDYNPTESNVASTELASQDAGSGGTEVASTTPDIS